MFDRYTLTARKAVFLARYEASQFGSDMIETEHLLLGILGAGELTLLKPGAADSLESIRSQIAKRHPPGKSISTTVDLPLSKEAQRVLAHASKEAQKLKHNEIGIEHLLLGILLEQKSFAAGLLRGIGATPETLREEAKRCHIVGSEAVTPIEETPPLVDGARSLTQAALTGTLGLLIGREHELDRAIQILSRRTRNNLVLVGEPGVGKTALVEGLAHRIAEGNVPPDLAERQVLSIDASALAAHKRQGRPGDPPEASHLPFPNRPNTILCVEGLFDLAITGAGWGVMDALHFLEPLLSQGGLRCIATGTPFGFRQTLEKAGALAHHFEAIHVMPPSEEEATQVVLGLKDQYERFHGVLISDDAVTTAVRASGRFLLNRQLPDRALDLIDEAGARLKLRRESEPREIVELRRRIRQHTRNMESAIACHEFTKAREHAEAQSTDRENLMRLLEERKTKGEPDKTLTPQDIEEVIASRTGAPLAAVQAVMRQADSEEFARLAKELAAQVPVELREGVAFLATWLAACSSDDAERLASSIRSVKTKRTA